MHDLEIKKNGEAAMFYTGEVPPWHGLGKKLDNPPSCAEAIVAAGLDWKVEKRPLFVQKTVVANDEFTQGLEHTEYEQVRHFANVRTSDQKVLGFVGPDYHLLQNSDAFNFFDPFVREGVVTLDTAGSLKGGRRVWVLGKVQGEPTEIVKNDSLERYVLLSNSHDGSLAIRTGFTAVRVVCNNTLQYAVGSKGSKLLRVKHTAKAAEALSEIQGIMDVANAEFEASVEKMRSLVRKGVVKNDIAEYVRLVFQPKIVLPDEEDGKKHDPCARLVDNIIPLFETGRGNDMPGVRGTMWAAYNAITEYISHERGRNQDNRVDSVWFGDGAKVAQRALDVAVKMVAVG